MRAGDHVVIARASRLQPEPTLTEVLTQVLMTNAPAQASGQTATVTGAFDDVQRTEQLTIDVDPSQFEAHPSPFSSWDVGAIAGPAASKGIRLGPDLFGVLQTSVTTAPVTTTVSYGNPFEPSWTTRLSAEYQTMHQFGLASIQYRLAYEERPLAAGTFTFEPLPPATNLAIDGHAIGGDFQVTPGASLPLDGTVADGASIGITVFHVVTGTASTPEIVASLFTDRLPVELPADIFTSGEQYVLEVTSYASDGDRNRSSSMFTDPFTYIAQ
jgi:hypothetical protein